MELIRPSYKITTPDSQLDAVLRRIEEAGRTAYKSGDKITSDSAESFVNKIIILGHHSVLEHESMTVRFIVNRGFTHEEVRHRLCSYTQESTRFVDLKGKHIQFIVPPHFYPMLPLPSMLIDNHKSLDSVITTMNLRQYPTLTRWMRHMLNTEDVYKYMRLNGHPPQEARDVLCIALKTEIVHTANMREWRHIFSLRATKEAHPQMQEQMDALLTEMKTRIPILFDDIPGVQKGKVKVSSDEVSTVKDNG